MSFKKDKYQIIRNAVSKEVCDIVYRYLQISAEADYWLLQNNATHENNPLIGNFKDKQVPNSYAKYARNAAKKTRTITLKIPPTVLETVAIPSALPASPF